MKNSCLLVMVTATVYLTSCQKDFTVSNAAASATAADSNFISKIYIVAADASSTDTVHIYTFNYDNLKRVINYSDSLIEPTNPGVNIFKYFYTGSETLPFKSEANSLNPGGIAANDTKTKFYSYNASLQRTKDSVLEYLHNAGNYIIAKVIQHYQYAGNIVYGNQATQILYDQNGIAQDFTEKDTATTDASGNILSNKKFADYPGFIQYRIVSDFTYDTKLSPFGKLNIGKLFPVFPNGETSFAEMAEKNNRLKTHEVTTYPGFPADTYDEDLTGKYTYRSTGFPSYILISNPALPTDYEKIIFVYKNL